MPPLDKYGASRTTVLAQQGVSHLHQYTSEIHHLDVPDLSGTQVSAQIAVLHFLVLFLVSISVKNVNTFERPREYLS